MAALAADTDYRFDARYEIGLNQEAAVGADTYYRGGLAHQVLASGLLTLTPAAVDFYVGVVSEHKVVAAANELVWVATSGRWYVAAVALAVADLNRVMQMPAAALFDNPADIVVNAVGAAGGIGTFYKVITTAVDGWVNTDHRALVLNS